MWSESRGFGHRIGGPALDGSLDDQVFSVLALLDAYEATLDPRYFAAAQKTMDLAMARYGDAEGGGFFDRPSDAAPMGGLDVRRKPFQDSPTPGANSVAAIALIRMHAFTGDERYYNFAQKTLEAFAGIAPQYGMFAATYGLAATLFARHPLQVVITGRADDPCRAGARSRSAQRLSFRQVRLAADAGRFTRESRRRAQRNVAASSGRQSAGGCLRGTNLPAADQRSHRNLVALLENGAAGAAGS